MRLKLNVPVKNIQQLDMSYWVLHHVFLFLLQKKCELCSCTSHPRYLLGDCWFHLYQYGTGITFNCKYMYLFLCILYDRQLVGTLVQQIELHVRLLVACIDPLYICCRRWVFVGSYKSCSNLITKVIMLHLQQLNFFYIFVNVFESSNDIVFYI